MVKSSLITNTVLLLINKAFYGFLDGVPIYAKYRNLKKKPKSILVTNIKNKTNRRFKTYNEHAYVHVGIYHISFIILDSGSLKLIYKQRIKMGCTYSVIRNGQYVRLEHMHLTPCEQRKIALHCIEHGLVKTKNPFRQKEINRAYHDAMLILAKEAA